MNKLTYMAVERIAKPDLTNDALSLLTNHSANDDVVFFLGRLIAQGKMEACAPVLAKIACDHSRGKYARIVAIRGVMITDNIALKDEVWSSFTQCRDQHDHSILAELLDWAEPTPRGVEQILCLIAHAAPWERFNTSGLDHALHKFIDSLPVMSDGATTDPLGSLIEGLGSLVGEHLSLNKRNAECRRTSFG